MKTSEVNKSNNANNLVFNIDNMKCSIQNIEINQTNNKNKTSFCTKLAKSAKKVLYFCLEFFKWITLIKPLSLAINKLVDYSFTSGFKLSKKQQKSRKNRLLNLKIKNINTEDLKTSPLKKTNKKTQAREKAKAAIQKHEDILKKHKIFNLNQITPNSDTSKEVDGIYFKSNSENRTGKVIIFSLAKHYQAFHLKNYTHLLESGADVVLYNPPKLDISSNSSCLNKIMDGLITSNYSDVNSHRDITIHGYCYGANVALNTVLNMDVQDNEKPSLILDRPYENAYELARKVTIFSRLKKSYINKRWNLNKNSINTTNAHSKLKMTVLSPPSSNDLLLANKKGVSLSRKVFDKYTENNSKENIDKSSILLDKEATHWSPWTFNTHTKVREQLKEYGVINDSGNEYVQNLLKESFAETLKPRGFFAKKILRNLL